MEKQNSKDKEQAGVIIPTQQNESLSSVELKQAAKAAKSGVLPTVKVYNKDPYEAMKQAVDIFDKLTQLYSSSGGE